MKERTNEHWLHQSAVKAARMTTATLLAVVALGAAPAGALPIEARVGTGPDLATVVLEFEDRAGFVFEVAFDDAVATSGIDIMQALESEIPSFSLSILDFGFGLFIDAIAYDGHANGGYGGDELYWHYWTKDAELDPWISSPIGAVDRLVVDGAWDGWVYGTALAPVPEPGTALLVGLGLAGIAGFRRRDQSPVRSSAR